MNLSSSKNATQQPPTAVTSTGTDFGVGSGGCCVVEVSKCLQCGHPLQPSRELCVECGAPAAWSLGDYDLRSESDRSLRLIRRGTGRMVLFWATLFFMLLGQLVILSNSKLEPPKQLMLLGVVLNLLIIGLLLANVPRLRPELRNFLDTIRRPLDIGCATIVLGLILAGVPSALAIGTAVAKKLDLIATGLSQSQDNGLSLLVQFVEFAGWGMWGFGCHIVAQAYLRRLHGRAPLRLGYKHIIAIVLIGVTVAWLVPTLLSDGDPGMKIGSSRYSFLLPLLLLVSTVLVLAGVVDMCRLWYGVRKLLTKNQSPATE